MNNLNDKIWNVDRTLSPIDFVDKPIRDVAVIIVNRNRPDLTDYLAKQVLGFNTENLSLDLYVVDMGSDPEGRSAYTTIEYIDTEFRGKCFAHNVGVRQASLSANYRYYWIMMNDLRFDAQPDALTKMVNIMDAHTEIGIMSPTNIGVGKEYPGSSPETGQSFRKVSVCEYLCLLFRAEVIKEVGFLNPNFKYCWGAIHELSYKIYSSGKWVLAYCDEVQFEHLGGTTYGKVKSVVSRSDYMYLAMKFATEYLVNIYGENWDKKFEAILPRDITRRNTYSFHRNCWECELKKQHSVPVLERSQALSLRASIKRLFGWVWR